MATFVYDPWMIRERSIDEVCRFAAETGYEGIELSPRDDYFPLFERPAASAEAIAILQQSLRTHGIELASMWTVYRWAEPSDPAARAAAVSHFRRFISVARELGCAHISSEFGGSWQDVDGSREAFRRSIDEILPDLEHADITLSLDPHPGDWVEDGRLAVQALEEFKTQRLRLLYSAPHSFYLDQHRNIGAFLREVGSHISFVRVADTFDHRPMVRYIVNPLGAEVRVHQHLNIGEGEIDWPEVFGALNAIGYNKCISNSVFAWPDRVTESALLMRRKMAELSASPPA